MRSANRMLVVENDAELGMAITGMLRELAPQATVDRSESAEVAIGWIKDRDYDLIISDIFLSGRLSGLQLWTTCEPKMSKTPILLISGRLDVDRLFVTIGSRETSPPFLAKPFEPSEFRETVTGLMRARKKQRWSATWLRSLFVWAASPKTS